MLEDSSLQHIWMSSSLAFQHILTYDVVYSRLYLLSYYVNRFSWYAYVSSNIGATTIGPNINALKMDEYCINKCWLQDIPKMLQDNFFQKKKCQKTSILTFDVRNGSTSIFLIAFFSYFGALCAVRLLFLKYCLTVATAMMFLKKAAAAFLS